MLKPAIAGVTRIPLRWRLSLIGRHRGAVYISASRRAKFDRRYIRIGAGRRLGNDARRSLAACAEEFMTRNPQCRCHRERRRFGRRRRRGAARHRRYRHDVASACRGANANTPPRKTSTFRIMSNWRSTASPSSCNRANPVAALDFAQLRDIFTGKVRNWRDLGGADAEIVAVRPRGRFGNGRAVRRARAGRRSPMAHRSGNCRPTRPSSRRLRPSQARWAMSASARCGAAATASRPFRFTRTTNGAGDQPSIETIRVRQLSVRARALSRRAGKAGGRRQSLSRFLFRRRRPGFDPARRLYRDHACSP